MAENIVIIGSGPAGYTAAIYAARAGLKPVVIAGPEPGGQLVTTTTIENFPGFAKGIDAFELIESWKKQAEFFGTRVRYDTVIGLNIDHLSSSKTHTLTLEGGSEIQARSIIVSTGASAKWLGIPGEEEYKNRGISSCATCDGFAFRGKNVVVIGGGDTAFEEALYLSNLCSKVHILHRRTEFRASNIMVERATNKENIYFLLNAQTESFYGTDDRSKLKGLVYWLDGQRYTFDVDGVFVAIGHTPNTGFLNNSNIEIAKCKDGYILNKPESNTSMLHVSQDNSNELSVIDGLFAAGDCVDKVYRQAITAAGDGCRAALDAERYLRTLE